MRRSLALATLAALVPVVTAGCSSPLASRRAQVLEPGELEVSLVPYVEGTKVFAQGSTSYSPVDLAYPSGEATARFGVMERVDVQLKVDPTIIPEVNVAVQAVGDPSKDEFALTFSGGVKPTIVAMPGFAGGLITVPLEVIADIPISDALIAVAGARVIPAYLFATSLGAGGGTFTIAPGVFGAVHMKLGDTFFVRPELAINGAIPLVGNALGQTTVLAGQGNTVNVAASLGVGATFDFGKKAAPSADAPPAPLPPM
jgi:hypothetical protein